MSVFTCFLTQGRGCREICAWLLQAVLGLLLGFSTPRYSNEALVAGSWLGRKQFKNYYLMLSAWKFQEELLEWITGKIDVLRKGFCLLSWILALGVASDLQPTLLVQTQFVYP